MTTVEEVSRETVLGVGVWMPSAPDHPGNGRRDQQSRVSNGRIEDPRAAPSRDVEDTISNSEPGSLAVQLESANGELRSLRQRLFELNCSDIQTVQLANAAVEIDALRQRLFELHSYRIAYERLREERSRPPMQKP